ncbi:TetR/AcrR family transcriptional regulator [Roseivirga sp.]|uniref:TetR/AcrR family transcriptional regulator n=1 Tax=Roseivirga sp. TaxID=1964215 RepID=UPI003B8C4DF2
MEQATATKKSKSKVDPAKKIKAGYINYVLEHGSKPASIFKFVKELKIKESSFYDEFNSFENIERAIWEDLFNETAATIKAESVYDEYSSREKLLAFFYTWIEVLKTNRSFILQSVPQKMKPEFTPYFLSGVKDGFKSWIAEVLLEAKETEEVTVRPIISDRYDDAIWLQFLFILGFWVKDDSKGFEKTDAAIEKSVNLAFDLMGRGPLDAMVDFGKFLFQNR